MTDMQIWILLGGILVISWGVILINTKLGDLLDHLYRFSAVANDGDRLAKKYGSLTDNQEIISNQLDNLNHQLMALREDNEIPKVLRQIRHYVSGGTVEEMKEMEGWHSEYS